MRIAVVNWSRRRVGGVEGYLGDVIPALFRAGHAVMFWYETDRPLDRDPIALPDAVPAVCAAERGVAAAIAALRTWQPDLIYAHRLDDPGIESQLLAMTRSVFFAHGYYGTCISGSKTFKRPVVRPCSRVFGWPCLMHYFPHGCGGHSPSTMVREYRKQSARLAQLRRYDAIVTHSDHMRDELTRHGLASRQVGFPLHREHAPRAHAVNAEAWRLLFAGRMELLKGGHVLLQALSRVRAGLGRAVWVTFAGDGPARARWERLAANVERGTADVRVEFVGWVEPARLDNLMAEADLLVVPSLWPEPFGAVGPAAGSQGLPAAAFAVGGIPHWLVDGVNGYLAPGDPPSEDGLADAIVRCLADPQSYARLRAGAVEVAQRFSMAAHLASLLSVFQQVASKARARHAG